MTDESKELVIVPGEPLVLTEEESRLLGQLWDWQRRSARRDYLFTDKPPKGFRP